MVAATAGPIVGQRFQPLATATSAADAGQSAAFKQQASLTRSVRRSMVFPLDRSAAVVLSTPL